MKRFSRTTAIVIGSILGVFGLLLIVVNMYVQSQTTHNRIERELSARLEATVRLGTISVTPWGGLRLNGITIPQLHGAAGDDFLRAKAFRLRIHFPSLFQQRLVIKEISLVEPSVVWAQNSEGKWRLPNSEQPKVEVATTTAPPQPEIAPAQTPPLPAPTPATSTEMPPPATAAAFKPELRRVNLIGGRLRFLDQHARAVATFDAVQFRSNFRNAADVRGLVTIGKTSLRDRFFLQRLQARLTYGPAALELADVTAAAGDGGVTGSFRMEPQTADSPFAVKVNFRDVQANRVVVDAGGPAGVVAGKLEGFLDATGRTADPNALAGTGEIVLRGGQLRRFSLLESIGQLLQIPELQQLTLDDAHAKFHITPGVVNVDEIVLRSPNARLSGSGTIDFDGALHINSQLAITDKIRKQLFRAIRENFQPTDEPEFAAVHFEIGGTLDQPQSNLMERLVGTDMNHLGNIVNAFFGGRKSRKAAAPTPTATPTPQP